ncbi:XK-related protein 7-like [Synchiropus picturatus]
MAAKSDGTSVSLRNQGPRECPPRPEAFRYSVADCCWTLCSLLVFFWDAASDLWLSADYFLRQQYRWFALTLVFAVIPSAVVQNVSFQWFICDLSLESGSAAAAAAEHGDFSTKESGERGAAPELTGPVARGGGRRCCRLFMWLFLGLVHLFQLSQVWRFIHILYLGAQSCCCRDPPQRHYWRTMFQTADVHLLRLLESFLKSAPQLVLQLTIMVQSQQVLPLQGLSASASLLSLSWTLSSYQKFLRDSREDKQPLTYHAVLVHILWHVFSVGARALAFALFASVFHLQFCIFLMAHWCVMTFWIVQGETDFCTSKWKEVIYDMLVGVIYVFCWFSVREGPTRFRMLVYNVTVFAENVALTVVWYQYQGQWTTEFLAVTAVCAVASSYALGTFFMFVYYCLLHPDGPASTWEKEPVVTSPVSSLAPDLLSSPPRTLQRTKGSERETGRALDGDVFQVRLTRGTRTRVAPLSPKTEGPVIRIDLPRKKYPALDAHYMDRRLRKTILVLENAAPVTPQIQYRCLTTPTEVMEFETTV